MVKDRTVTVDRNLSVKYLILPLPRIPINKERTVNATLLIQKNNRKILCMILRYRWWLGWNSMLLQYHVQLHLPA